MIVSFLPNLSLCKKSRVFTKEREVRSAMLLPSTFTARLSFLSLVPLHSSQGSSSTLFPALLAPRRCLDAMPKPLHAGHAPCGLLKENSRGVTSGKESPHWIHADR